jgi:hypothetical protein
LDQIEKAAEKIPASLRFSVSLRVDLPDPFGREKFRRAFFDE